MVKNPARTLRHLVPDGCPLSFREFQLLEHLAEGKVYKQIADDLGLAPSTVRTHLHHAYARLGVIDRGQAVILGFRKGWLRPDGAKFQPPEPDPDPKPKLSYCQQRYNETVARYARTHSSADDYAMGVWCDAMFLEKGLAPPSLKRGRDRPVSDWLDHLHNDHRIT